MGLFSWLFRSEPKEPSKSKKDKPRKRKVYGFDEKRADFQNELIKFKKSNLGIKKIKIIIDKQDLDTCSAIKRMKKVHDINETPLIPLDREKCLHCTCYYEPILPNGY